MSRRRRGVIYLALAVLYLAALPGTGLALATATPTLTPTPMPTNTPQGYNSNSNFSSMVNINAALPWPLPQLPTFASGTATPTLYAATPAHATDYAGSAGTATAQVGQFTGPIHQLSTPIANVVDIGPTPVGGELNTGIDVGGGTISFLGFATDIGETTGTVVGIAMGFLDALVAFLEYSPVLAALLIVYATGIIVAAFIALMVVIIQAVNWLINFTIRLLTMFGSFKP